MRYIGVFILVFSLYALEPGETGYNYLKIPVSVYQVILNDAYTAYSEDINAFFSNPAVFRNPMTISGEGTRYVGGINLGTFSFGISKDLSIGAFYLNSGKMAKIDENDNYLGEFSVNQIALLLSRGYSISEKLRIGGNVKGLFQNIDNYSAWGIAIDLGAYYDFREDIKLGASLKNLGYEVKPFISERSILPVAATFGGIWIPNRVWKIGAGFTSSIDRIFTLSLSALLTPFPILTVGAGYNTASRDLNTGSERDILNGFSFGLVLRWKSLKVGYAFVPFGDLGDIHRIGISYGKRD
jgi:hypothetical protein